jgi:parvulin-like peptidyl-prolyl isomerase
MFSARASVAEKCLSAEKWTGPPLGREGLRWRWRLASAGICCTAIFGIGGASGEGETAEQPVVVAKVDGEPIYAAEVTRLADKVTRGKNLSAAALPLVQAQVLSEIIDRRLVLAYARRTKSAPREAEIDAALAEVTGKLASQGQSLADYLQAQSITETELRRQLAWNLVWPKDLARYVTDARVESYFQAHRRELDGSEVSVSHILLRPKPGAGPRGTAELVQQAQTIREEITSGKISFAEAARKYSAGPSAQNDGRLGFVARHGAMSEAFSRASFGLEVGQVSEPVATPFGVHVIRCDEIKPGSKSLGEVRKSVEEALARELLDKLARQQQGHTAPEFTGAAPYFKPGTRELIVP